MNNRILVTYASRAGSTAEVALAIGGTLRARGFAVDVEPIKEKPKLEGYGAVLIGSAVRMGNWLPEAVQFVKANRRALNRVPVALFTVHLMNLGDDEQSRQNREAYLNCVRPYVRPVDEVFFAGKDDPARLSLIDRLTSQTVGPPVARRTATRGRRSATSSSSWARAWPLPFRPRGGMKRFATRRRR